MLYILKSPHKKFKNKHHNLQLIITILSKVSMKVHFQKLVKMGSWDAGIFDVWFGKHVWIKRPIFFEKYLIEKKEKPYHSQIYEMFKFYSHI